MVITLASEEQRDSNVSKRNTT